MAQTYQRWPTEAEAQAFARGVEHANDSALQIREVYEDEHPTQPWVVLMEDEDADEDMDPRGDLPTEGPGPGTARKGPPAGDPASPAAPEATATRDTEAGAKSLQANAAGIPAPGEGSTPEAAPKAAPKAATRAATKAGATRGATRVATDGLRPASTTIPAGRPPVTAEVHTDDWAVKARFDASAWLATLTDAMLLVLAREGFGTCREAGGAAYWAETRSPEVWDLFQYLSAHNRSARRPIGFEVTVDEGQARAWIAVHRPALSPRLP